MCSSEIHRRCPAARLSPAALFIERFFLSSPAALKGRRGLPDGEDQVAFENLSRSLLNPRARAGWPGGPARPGSAPPASPWGTWPVLMSPDRRACPRDWERVLKALERTHESFLWHGRGDLRRVDALRSRK